MEDEKKRGHYNTVFDDLRKTIINMVMNEGESVLRLAQSTGVAPSTIQSILNVVRMQGRSNGIKKKSKGRPEEISSIIKGYLTQWIDEPDLTLKTMKRRLEARKQ